MKEVIKGVWRGEGWPESWKNGIISPFYKKGNMLSTDNYRGITRLFLKSVVLLDFYLGLGRGDGKRACWRYEDRPGKNLDFGLRR